MIHRNMHEMVSVLRTEFSNTWRVIRRFSTAAANAVSAPIAELSTRLVQPLMNGMIIAAKMISGNNPARSRRSFSARATRRSSTGSTGPSWGCRPQRTAM